MLNIFRRTRKLHLNSSQARKYILYAIGEIALVVIGILIALQINNWNENRTKQQRIRIYLQNLVETIVTDITHLNSSKGQNASRVNCLNYILLEAGIHPVDFSNEYYSLPEGADSINWSKISPGDNDRSFIDLCFERSTRGGVQVINTSALDEFKASGLFSFIKNEPLKKQINLYYNRYEWFFSTWRESKFRERAEDWENLVRQKYQINLFDISEVNDPVGLVKEHVEIQLEIKRLIEDASWRARSAQIMIEMGEEVIRSIKEELDK